MSLAMYPSSLFPPSNLPRGANGAVKATNVPSYSRPLGTTSSPSYKVTSSRITQQGQPTARRVLPNGPGPLPNRPTLDKGTVRYVASGSNRTSHVASPKSTAKESPTARRKSSNDSGYGSSEKESSFTSNHRYGNLSDRRWKSFSHLPVKDETNDLSYHRSRTDSYSNRAALYSQKAGQLNTQRIRGNDHLSSKHTNNTGSGGTYRSTTHSDYKDPKEDRTSVTKMGHSRSYSLDKDNLPNSYTSKSSCNVIDVEKVRKSTITALPTDLKCSRKSSLSTSSSNNSSPSHYQENVDGLSTILEEPLERKGGQFEVLVDPEFSEKVVPLEINLRGPLALEAYNKALSEGKACVKRVPVMLIGQDRSGKTSLKKSLMGKRFNKGEESTVGIDVDPSYFKVSTEIWRAGENDQTSAHSVEAISYEQHAARLVAKHLKEKQPVGVGDMKSVQSGDIPLVDTKLDDRKHVPKASSDDRSDPTQWKEEHSPLPLPEIPDEVATLIKKVMKEVEKVQDEDEIYSVLWDFGGQSVYYATHPLFITPRAMYLLVYDLSRDLHERAKPVVKQGMFNEIVDNFMCSMKTNLDYLNFWMTSVASFASQDQNQQTRSGPKSEVLRVNIPPVFLVCTHADEPCGRADPFALAHKVFDSLQTKSYKTQLYEDVFVVDNTKSGTESECSEVIRLRENICAVAMELPQMREAIPIKWLRYENALQVTVKEGRKWISLEMAKQIAYEVCKIEDDQEFLTLLDFLHDQRILIHFDDTPVLNNMVVLDPQWLVNVFKKVITVKPYQQEEREFKELWYRLESTGILDEKLLEHVWGPLLDQQETSASLIEIMEKFSLLCPWPSSDASCGKQYLVPSMLMSHPPQDIIELIASAQIPSLFLKFESGQVPPGLFPRLVLQFFQWGQDEFWSSENPQLYHSFARFYTSEDEDCSVILLCHSSSIEVVVHRGNLSADLTERFQSKLNSLADVNCGAFELACARAVHRKLGLMLECMRKEFCWLKNMKYVEGFICSVCCQGHAVKYCSTHHKQDCEQEECLHFWFESDLRSAKPFVRCRRCAAAKNDQVQVKQFAPWISETSDEQHTIDESDGRIFVPERDNDEKLLALPTKALESLLSQPCDSKEVVLQLKDSLQLDQASLEQPDPETKRLIRCLAIKANESERLDVVKHLREITPAGTTGPLLPEHLDIRDIPVRQMTELTVELSGGEDWKLVAEELGLTPQEIRFLDKRTLNPCEAVLAFISKRQYVSVGSLYDGLNKCGLPVTADIL